MINPGTLLLILELVDLVAEGIKWLAEDREKYDRFKEQVIAMIKEGREPTEAEFMGLVAESREITARLRRAAVAAGS